MEKVSIIIPVYNTVSLLLENCVKSALYQDYTDIEIIIVDDGSTDYNTVGKCKDLNKRYEKVKYIRQKNQGPSVARGTGIKEASGEYLMFLDSDDALSKDACSYLIEIIHMYGGDIAEAAAKETHGNKVDDNISVVTNISDYSGTEALLDKLAEGCNAPLSWSLWGKLFKTKIIQKSYIEYPNLIRGEDVLALADYVVYINRLVYSEKCIYYYNQMNTDSITKKYVPKQNLSLCIVWKNMIELYSRNGSRQALEKVKANYCTSLFGALIQCTCDGSQEYSKYKLVIKKEMRNWVKEYFINKHINRRFRCLAALICPELFMVAKKLKYKGGMIWKY